MDSSRLSSWRNSTVYEHVRAAERAAHEGLLFPAMKRRTETNQELAVKQMSLRTWGVRCTLVAVAALALVFGSPLASAHSASSSSSAGKRWTIHGHLVPAVRNLKALGAANGAQALDLSISLSLRNQSALNALIAAQNNPHSPLYHQYLTPAQFAAQFSPTRATVKAVTAYLRSQGLVVHSISSNRTLIDASGSVATVERAF